MDVFIRRLTPGDRPAAARLLDQTVGAGFWGFCEGAGDLSAVASRRDDLAGVVVAALEPATGEDAKLVFGPESAAAPGSSLLHVRALAVAPQARRGGIASRLLSLVEQQAAEAGAAAAYLFAWLPAGQPEPAAVPFYLAAGYAAPARHPGLLRGGQPGLRRRVPVLRRAALPLRGAPLLKRLAAR